MSLKVGINGFGRIGRAVVRASLAKEHNDIEIVHVNDLFDCESNAHLLEYDSVHGKIGVPVSHTENSIRIGEKTITFSSERDPANIAWGKYGVDIVLECTGVFRKRADAEKHMAAGAKKVLISAPGSGEDLTVVKGVNCDKLKPEHKIVSNGSCTTNCLAPVAKIIHEKFHILSGYMTTVHSYTRDQELLDSPHKDLRRARAAALNIIPTTTGAAKALGLVIPELKGKLDGIALRVPTANVSLVDVCFNVRDKTTKDQVNDALALASESGSLKGIMGYSNRPLVSQDFMSDSRSSIVDGLSTAVMDGTLVKVMSWYDNEMGFSYRMLDIARLMFKG